MSLVVRYTVITNPTGAVLTIGANSSADEGDEFSTQKITRYFSAADVGTGAGQTRDNTDPTGGCLVATFQGSRIFDVTNLTLNRQQAATNTLFNYPIIGTANNTTKVGWRVVYNPQNGISAIYIFDAALGTPGQILADDWVQFDVVLGSSSVLTPLG